jgi:hypothetical protein
VFNAGYDVARLAFLLADLPVEVLGRPPAQQLGPAAVSSHPPRSFVSSP